MLGAIKTGGLVAYGGRAGRVRGIETVRAAGVAVEALAIEHTGSPRGVVFVPLPNVGDAVQPISEAQAAALDADVRPACSKWGKAARRVGAKGAAVLKARAVGRARDRAHAA